MTGQELKKIRKLVGPVSKEQLRYIDCFVGENVGLFTPVGGACFYALTPEHTHPSYMFVLDFSARTSIRLDRKTISGRPGRILALSPDVPHQELPSDVPPQYICILISRRFFDQQYRFYSRSPLPALHGNFLDPGEGFVHLLKRFMIEADCRAAGTVQVLEALAVEICHSLIRMIIKVPASGNRIAERVEVNRVIEYISSHFDKKITLEVMASVAHLSVSHFARVFRGETGKAPMEFVQELRLERAKKLLLAGDKSMTEIALECGFNSPSYLSSCFQKEFNVSPSEYQKRIKAGKN